MRIGVPREIKIHEYRVGLVPAGVRELAGAGHQVLVETGAGAGINVDDAQYRAAGALIAPNATEVFTQSDLIVKVKEPQLIECAMLRAGQTLFTYLHLVAGAYQLTDAGRNEPHPVLMNLDLARDTDTHGSTPLKR